MAGIYIHIPYCKQACHYCDFHFSTTRNTEHDFLKALKKEIVLRKEYLRNQEIETIYFGGGTPSLLSTDQLKGILEELSNHFNIHKNAEITLEANPDDLDEQKAAGLKASGINRLSIGIQSFREEDLRFMNRAHSSEQASVSVKMAQDKGFGNITIDLIYGIPDLSDEAWRKNLHTAFQLNVQHISSYCLTVESKTPLAKMVKEGKVPAVDDLQSESHFRILKEEMNWNEFIHYEISNFGKKDYFSKHNSNYWKGVHYLGLGPSAHSFNGHSRQWNIANNPVYISSLGKGELNFTSETLTPGQQYNEYVMTSLRTIWGCDLGHIRDTFGEKTQEHCSAEAEFYIHSGKLIQRGNVFVLTEEGMLIADKIAGDLFLV